MNKTRFDDIAQGETYAKIIAHSKSVYDGSELITLELKAPKFLDAEFEKSRRISSSSTSDRAIPWVKQVFNSNNLFLMKDIRSAGKGMVSENSVGDVITSMFRSSTYEIFQYIIAKLERYSEDIHKQHLNRYILPFMFQRKIATATKNEWDYFLGLRDAYDADPAIQELAVCIKEAITGSDPVELKYGEWHLPYLKNEEERRHPRARDISAARCARVSYDNLDNTVATIEKDLPFSTWLVEHFHRTPFEHQGTPMPHFIVNDDGEWLEGITHCDRYGNYWSANFKGWIQYRKIVDNGMI